MEKKKVSYQNANVEADSRASNNRLLFFVPNLYHASVLHKVLEEEIEKVNALEDDEPAVDFDPGKFLKERILE